ncbi:MAG: bifunctional phosphoglucose/phosphomannose isomerase [candidate division Zixibacteria bacterium CG_4_9_14_3_um_filter_46_8]|nr:MAG: bifunctional phosphoglucose/phosphomannose isomerase [candidate division Zixibacteria bacterium CG_4_9_14_3_um_filter_46_8]
MAKFGDLDAIKKLDGNDMFSKLIQFPDQIRSAISVGYEFIPSQILSGRILNIVVAGMGGSAIGGDLARSYLSQDLKVPMMVHRDYALPGFVDENSLVIVASYSGSTEETLSAYSEGKRKKAKIIVISSGGELSLKAQQDGTPLIKIPEGFMPRAALGYLFFPILIALAKIGICSESKNMLLNVADFLEGRIPLFLPGVDEKSNPAKSIARKLYNRIPIIYSARKHYDAVSLRFKGQLSENSKSLAFCNVFPELNHNEFVGFEKLAINEDKLIVLIIRDQNDYDSIRKRMDIVSEMLEERGIETLIIQSRGELLLERIFSLIQLADFSSFYLAILNDCDPTPIDAIERLKRELKNRS